MTLSEHTGATLTRYVAYGPGLDEVLTGALSILTAAAAAAIPYGWRG